MQNNIQLNQVQQAYILGTYRIKKYKLLWTFLVQLPDSLKYLITMYF